LPYSGRAAPAVECDVRLKEMEELNFLIRGFPRAWAGALVPVILGGYYIFVTDASLTSKSVVGFLFAISLVVVFAAPIYWLWVLLLQVAVGVYIAFYLAWRK
jgi:hypothetical protein